MPSVPKWLGDTMDAVFSKMYHPVNWGLNISSILPACSSKKWASPRMHTGT